MQFGSKDKALIADEAPRAGRMALAGVTFLAALSGPAVAQTAPVGRNADRIAEIGQRLEELNAEALDIRAEYRRDVADNVAELRRWVLRQADERVSPRLIAGLSAATVRVAQPTTFQFADGTVVLDCRYDPRQPNRLPPTGDLLLADDALQYNWLATSDTVEVIQGAREEFGEACSETYDLGIELDQELTPVMMEINALVDERTRLERGAATPR